MVVRLVDAAAGRAAFLVRTTAQPALVRLEVRGDAGWSIVRSVLVRSPQGRRLELSGLLPGIYQWLATSSVASAVSGRLRIPDPPVVVDADDTIEAVGATTTVGSTAAASPAPQPSSDRPATPSHSATQPHRPSEGPRHPAADPRRLRRQSCSSPPPLSDAAVSCSSPLLLGAGPLVAVPTAVAGSASHSAKRWAGYEIPRTGGAAGGWIGGYQIGDTPIFLITPDPGTQPAGLPARSRRRRPQRSARGHARRDEARGLDPVQVRRLSRRHAGGRRRRQRLRRPGRWPLEYHRRSGCPSHPRGARVGDSSSVRADHAEPVAPARRAVPRAGDGDERRRRWHDRGHGHGHRWPRTAGRRPARDRGRRGCRGGRGRDRRQRQGGDAVRGLSARVAPHHRHRATGPRAPPPSEAAGPAGSGGRCRGRRPEDARRQHASRRTRFTGAGSAGQPCHHSGGFGDTGHRFGDRRRHSALGHRDSLRTLRLGLGGAVCGSGGRNRDRARSAPTATTPCRP